MDVLGQQLFLDESALLKSWSHVYCRLNPLGEIQAASLGFLRVLGLEWEDVADCALADFLENELLLDHLSCSEPFLLKLRNKSGVVAKGDFICHKSGSGIVLLGSRITAAENEQDALNDDFEKMIFELQLTQKKLKQSNEDLEQFAYVASHDLKEPLRTIKSYIELIQRRYKDSLDAEGNEFLDFAVDGARRMQLMIDGLLSLSRIGTKGQGFENCNAQSQLQGVVSSLEARIQETSAQIVIDVDLPIVNADPRQIDHLFENLLLNALKFNTATSPEIHLGATSLDDGFWQFYVRDNGIGISPEHVEKIFGVFKRLHSSSEYEGSGLGLAICQKIIDRHGGRIWVESLPGEGSTFFFTLPGAGADS